MPKFPDTRVTLSPAVPTPPGTRVRPPPASAPPLITEAARPLVPSPPGVLTEDVRQMHFEAALYHAGRIVASMHFGKPAITVIPCNPDGSRREASVFAPYVSVDHSDPSSRLEAEEKLRKEAIIVYAGACLTSESGDYQEGDLARATSLVQRLRTDERRQEALFGELWSSAEALMRRPEYVRAVLALASRLFATAGDMDADTAMGIVHKEIDCYRTAMEEQSRSARLHRLVTSIGSAKRVLLPG